MSRLPQSNSRLLPGGGGNMVNSSSRTPLSKRPRFNNDNNPYNSTRVFDAIARLNQNRQQQQPSESEKSNSGSESPSRSPSPSPSRSPSPSDQEQDDDDDDDAEEEEEAALPPPRLTTINNNNNSIVGVGVMLSNPRVLDCTTCLLPLVPPVYQCDNGHFVCAQCSSIFTRRTCTSCSTPIKNNRSRGIEMVLQSANSPCQYTSRGCKAKLTYAIKRQHESSCKYAPSWCPTTGCNFSANGPNLYNHFANFHSSISRLVYFNNPIQITLGKDVKQVYLHERTDKKLFVLNRNSVDLGSLINVICVAPASSRLEYTYELTATHVLKKITLKSSVDNTPKLNRAQSPKENCLVITNGFTKTNGALSLELNIRMC